MIAVQQLVAHRGFPQRYPENSLAGIQAAMDAGALWLEWDVQLSADRTPVVFHDTTLKRMAGQDGEVLALEAEPLGRVRIGQLPDRTPIFIPTLEQAVERVVATPEVRVFVELKTESIDHFGQATVLRAILPILSALGDQAIIISFDSQILKLARDSGHRAIGWVIKNPNLEARQTARRLEPDFLLINRKKLWAMSGALWQGSWRWVAYTTDSLSQISKLIKQGFDWVETNDIGGIIEALDGDQ